MMNKGRLFITLTLMYTLITSLLQSACSVTAKPVKPDRRFELMQGELHQGELRSNNLNFTYQYDYKGNYLSLNGEIDFFSQRVRRFQMTVHFVDIEGMILDSYAVTITKSSQRGKMYVSFSNQVPLATRSMAFSYRGEIRDGMNESKPVSFWRKP